MSFKDREKPPPTLHVAMSGRATQPINIISRAYVSDAQLLAFACSVLTRTLLCELPPHSQVIVQSRIACVCCWSVASDEVFCI